MDNISFREFVELIQEASGDRAKKIAKLEMQIKQLEHHITGRDNSNPRYFMSKDAQDDKAELHRLEAQLRRYRPTKAPSAQQRRKKAADNIAYKQKEEARRAEKEAADKKAAEQKAIDDKIHKQAHEASHEWVNKNIPEPKRHEGENIMDYITRTMPETSARNSKRLDKYYEIRKQLRDEHDKKNG